ncbi:MAG: serine/threonine protein kinase [Planctomycetes bacterium]|nr:serine/threonine protein kinase [Planctomycetota bacterium]
MLLEQLGPYRIGRQLGKGGMGTVYAAVDTQTNAPAAVKVLAPQLAMQAGFRERFEAEIESLKKLHHPNIVQLFGYGQQEEVLFYAMELVEGISLEDELAHGRRFDWREVCQIGIQLCRALKLAHDHGVIHRDIKPANLLLMPDGNVKLTDFGIARLFGNTGVTSEGGVLGTAEYMAPEQADGRRTTHHCDLYSLGGVMYALLAGRPPFRSQSLLEMLQMQRYSTPEPVRRFAPDTPEEFEQIIMQLLAKEPQERFPNALLLSRRLEAMQRGLSLHNDGPEGNGAGTARPRPAPRPVRATIAGDQGGVHVRSTQTGAATPASATSDFSVAGASFDDESVLELQTPSPVVATRFTTLEEEQRREAELQQQRREPLMTSTTVLLVLTLVAIVGLVIYALQPPSADTLYGRIDTAASANDSRKLSESKDDVARFLKLYPGDSRAGEVQAIQARIDSAKTGTSTLSVVQAKILVRRHPLSPLGNEYLEAVKLGETDPARALVRLQAIVNLYGHPEKESPGIRDFVEAARAQLPALRERVDALTLERRALINDRLKQADAIAEKDPKQATRIRQAIVDLYQDEPWAAPLVAKARQALVGKDGSALLKIAEP